MIVEFLFDKELSEFLRQSLISIVEVFQTIVFICYIHNISADVSSSLLQVFVELWS